MKIETKRTVTLPYYYRQEHALECVAYGKIDEDEHTEIILSKSGKHFSRETTSGETDWDGWARYLEEEYRSTEEEFLRAEKRVMEILSRA